MSWILGLGSWVLIIMYELMVEDTFDAAHQLRGYKGKCESLHGHTFRVQVFLKGDKLDKIGMLEDFKKIKDDLNNIVKDFDHKNLNDLSDFKNQNPTSENIAKVIFQKMITKLKISKVTVGESGTSYASYYE